MKYAQFENNSFHVYGGPIENLFLNIFGDCFHPIENEDIGSCSYFERTFWCYKQKDRVFRKLLFTFRWDFMDCKEAEPKTSFQNMIGCVYKSIFSLFNLSENDYFNSTTIGNWFEKKFQNNFGKVMKKNIVSCSESINLEDCNVPTMKCENFYLYSNCWAVEIVKGLRDLSNIIPDIKGFVIEKPLK